MIKFGRGIRWDRPYRDEVQFSRENNFDFMQVWYKEGEIFVEGIDEPKEQGIKEIGFPIVFHGVFDINDFERHIPRLVEILNYFSHKEVIIHPICKSEEITDESIFKLAEKVAYASEIFRENGIKLFLENNSKIDPINYSARDLEIIFARNPDVELLLDIAHIDDYQHLEGIVAIKRPKILHIADKHFSIDHEHLAIGEGELDFEYIFNQILVAFSGKIIFEISDEDEKIVESKKVIERILND